MQCAVRSDVGRVRAVNEDATLAMPVGGVYAVADGMGGHNAGDVASRLAMESLRNRLRNRQPGTQALQTAVQETNLVLTRRAQDDEACQGMGTTLTLLWAKGASALLAHVGDSRAYLYRAGVLTQLTQDHSMVAELQRQGVLTAQEARRHPYRNVITRALGTAGYVEADILSLDLLPGDCVLLCSDGLTGMVDDERLCALLAREPLLEVAADALLEAALTAGGRDNVSLLLLRYDGEVSA